MQLYINGAWVDQADAVISVLDHGFLYGDGVFEGIRAYNGKVFKLKEHLDRLYDSAKAIRLTPPESFERMTELCNEALCVNKLTDAYLRVIFSRGVGDLGLNPNLCKKAGLVIIPGKIALYPKELYDNGMSVITAATSRNNQDSLNPKIKSLNYLNNILAKIEGLEGGYPEVLMLNSRGELAEATGDNIFLVKNGVLRTPPPSAGILLGITRQTVIDLAKAADIQVEELTLDRYDLYTADECFLTGTAAEIISVTRADGRTIGQGRPGEITLKLLGLFRDLSLA